MGVDVLFAFMADLLSELLVVVEVSVLRRVEGVIEEGLAAVFDFVGVTIAASILLKFPPEDRDVFLDTDKRNGSGHVSILGVVDNFLEEISGTGDPKASDFDTFVFLMLDVIDTFSIDVLMADFSLGELNAFDEESLKFAVVEMVLRATRGERFTAGDEVFTSFLL